jgi:uncharacterized OsmC-like protein
VRARAKTFEYAASLDRAGRLKAKDEAPLQLSEEWTPEHLVLAALMRCTVTSLRYHAERAGIDDLVASATAWGRVTKREQDERYAFVEVTCELEVELDPARPQEEIQELVSKAERDCFVGASLTAKPRYSWRVNGADI